MDVLSALLIGFCVGIFAGGVAFNYMCDSWERAANAEARRVFAIKALESQRGEQIKVKDLQGEHTSID